MVEQRIVRSDEWREDRGDHHREQHKAKDPAGVAAVGDQRAPKGLASRLTTERGAAGARSSALMSVVSATYSALR